MSALLDRLEIIFDANPDKEKLFTAPDGQVFFEEHEAWNHAQRFKDGVVTPWTLEKVEKAFEAEKTETKEDE